MKYLRVNKGVLAYIAICLIWGTGYLANRVGIRSFPPLLFLALRLSAAGCLLLFYALAKRLPFPNKAGQYLQMFGAGMLLFFGGNGFGILGLQTVTSGAAALIVSMVPIFAALIELPLPHSSKLGFGGWIGLLIGSCGVAFMVASGRQMQVLDPLGCFLAGLGALCWAAGSIYNSRTRNDCPLIIQIGWQMLFGGIALLALSLWAGDPGRLHPSAEAVVAFGYMLVFDAILANSLYIYLLRIWPAAKVGTYAYITPFIAGFFGVTLLGEAWSPQLILSGLIIIAGVILVQKSRMIGADTREIFRRNTDG